MASSDRIGHDQERSRAVWEVMVPLFIAPGEVIRVDTHERKYAGKEAVG